MVFAPSFVELFNLDDSVDKIRCAGVQFPAGKCYYDATYCTYQGEKKDDEQSYTLIAPYININVL